MRATIMYKPYDVGIENVPDAAIQEPTDAVIRIVRACICGSDLWFYRDGPANDHQSMGHEAIGIVEDVGSAVRTVKPGQLVIMPFVYSDGSCLFCGEGLQTACVHGGTFGVGGEAQGAQAEALRIPYADGTLYPLPVEPDEALMPSLLSLSDVMGTGHHAAVTARVQPGGTVAVVGDGAVGLCGVIAAKRLGAEQIIIMGHHDERIALAQEFGATDVVRERGEEGIARVRELTGGYGVKSVLECVGTGQAIETSIGIVRPGGAVGRVGVAHYESLPGPDTFFRNVTISGGPAPVRAYIEDLLPDVMAGTIQPGRVFDSTIGLDGVPDGYRAMDERQSLKVLIRP
ncbi:zinc-dependent alcohol dehydrogenase family protein [Novosphingobium beihaiensis]|uniref:Zinc-dependent alcohol dehydrogenase family protein n=1 Tax=Novosphingobium beihaiensis TaxID=2930389 RepID=A0ABT0BPS1_9SPHN|nr:zinc-dependent alcohol dehydrogenase family protein [Novosphingobium beihaiensis]MCJ2187032.1 zinc-dependent alcohol dehydrogenase family protein [Novosphingobium beihaiensis]